LQFKVEEIKIEVNILAGNLDKTLNRIYGSGISFGQGIIIKVLK